MPAIFWIMGHGHELQESSVSVDAGGLHRSVIVQDLTGIQVPQGVVFGPEVETESIWIPNYSWPGVQQQTGTTVHTPVVVVDQPGNNGGGAGSGQPVVMTPEPGTMLVSFVTLVCVVVKGRLWS
jgi:hypothetical protein